MSVKKWIASFILLTLGIICYLLFRPYSIFNGYFSNIIPTLDLPEKLDWISGSLPDALWYSALLLLQKPLFLGYKISFDSIITIIAILIPFVHEVSQLSEYIDGYFSYQDIFSYFVVLIIFIFLWNKKRILK